MDKEAVLKTVRRFASALKEKGISRPQIILYGSYARGDWHEWSDIDLLVVSQDFENMDYWERIEVLVEAIYKLREPIEAVAMTPTEWETGDSMIARYAREGEVVFSS